MLMILISTVTSSNPGHYVMLTLEQNPTAISNGFISKILDKWAYGHLLVPVTGRCSGALLNKSDFG
ncbi:Uncharacterised protein [Citrobacter werkmanii]|nr:Uncharacterised protein [Citrobacter werkmanii]